MGDILKFPKHKRVSNRFLLDQIKQFGCVICNHRPCDPSHIRSVGAGGPDKKFNVVPMCRVHHTEWHDAGWRTFLGRYPDFLDLLVSMGWEVIYKPPSARLFHPDLIK